ncbi:MAG: ISAzo13 family transposase [Desulfobacterales bacterium]|nr:ISAzo13 family transposase [Desulfobacterales bacterium]
MAKIDQRAIEEKYDALRDFLDERTRRLWAAAEARSLPYGGTSVVASVTGLSRTTILAGIKELRDKPSSMLLKKGSLVRRPGGGRKSLKDRDPSLERDLELLVEPLTRGDPQSPLRWTCKSTRKLAEELNRQGHRVGDRKVADLLHGLHYSLQANAKMREGSSHPDRNAQFEYINALAKAFQKRSQPVISVDTKKKELVGDFKNNGSEWQPKNQPEEVRVHDFEDKELGKVTPYGVYDIAKNEGWVTVGTDHDTSDFAIDTILAWWKRMGRHAYPEAMELLILADSGGSNGSRSRLWKLGVQRLANETSLKVTVCHFPPGTSKWNKIEHRLFSFITQNWRGRPLVSHEVIVNLIGSTTTKAGLNVKAKLSNKKYKTGIKVSDEDFARIKIKPKRFHGDWNYMISSNVVS